MGEKHSASAYGELSQTMADDIAQFMINTLASVIHTPDGQKQAALYLKDPILPNDARKFLVDHVATVALTVFQTENEAKALLADFFNYIRTASNLTVDHIKIIRDKVENFEFDPETYDEYFHEELREYLLVKLDRMIEFMQNSPLKRSPSLPSKPARAGFLSNRAAIVDALETTNGNPIAAALIILQKQL